MLAGIDKDRRMYLDEKRHVVAIKMIHKIKAKEREQMVEGFMRKLPKGKETRPQFTNLPNTNPLGRRFSRVGEDWIPDVNGDYEEVIIPVTR